MNKRCSRLTGRNEQSSNAGYQMLMIRNRAVSEARIRAAQTSRVGSSPDSDTKMDREFGRFPAGDGFIRLRSLLRLIRTQKRLRFPEAFF